LGALPPNPHKLFEKSLTKTLNAHFVRFWKINVISAKRKSLRAICTDSTGTVQLFEKSLTKTLNAHFVRFWKFNVISKRICYRKFSPKFRSSLFKGLWGAGAKPLPGFSRAEPLNEIFKGRALERDFQGQSP